MNFPYPFYPVQFKKDGTVFQTSDVDSLLNGVKAPTDLLVMCHGWNNNMDDAKDLYCALAGLIKVQVDATPALAGRTYVICGVLWPSKKFEDKDLIPSGAASLNDAVSVDQLKARVGDLRSLFAGSDWPGADAAPADLDEIAGLMESVEDDEGAQERVIDLLRPLLPKDMASTDDASDRFFEMRSKVLLANLKKPLNPPIIKAGSGAAALDPFSTGAVSGLGGAASYRDSQGGAKSGILNLLNYATYYLMKARAGTVGQKGVAPLLVQLRQARPDLRLHMIGHSFGCRMVAAAINALPEGTVDARPDTVLLLQGAFSHNGFALEGDETDRGAFRDVIEKKKVRGGILITYTRNDKAVGLAYPIASRIAGTTAAALGDADDIFGGLGSNGTQTQQTTPERVMGTMQGVGQDYPFAKGVKPSTPYNLKADEFIKGHSDIRKPEVAYALTVAMAAPAVTAAGM